ncbi:MAG: methylmalonyl Co-A mutase-associated GTPase MeaB, partial [Bacteroidota bacterium]
MDKPKRDKSALNVMDGMEHPAQINEHLAEKIKGKKAGDQEASYYIDGIKEGNRTILSQAITLIESVNPKHIEIAQTIIAHCLPYSGDSLRLGITGVPGVGKSTFIESFGKYLTAQGKKIAVLAVDPSSEISHGSILGDKTRMENLSRDSLAYIRPTPASGSIGGIA